LYRSNYQNFYKRHDKKIKELIELGVIHEIELDPKEIYGDFENCSFLRLPPVPSTLLGDPCQCWLPFLDPTKSAVLVESAVLKHKTKCEPWWLAKALARILDPVITFICRRLRKKYND
jgi:hypothetical protein